MSTSRNELLDVPVVEALLAEIEAKVRQTVFAIEQESCCDRVNGADDTAQRLRAFAAALSEWSWGVERQARSWREPILW